MRGILQLFLVCCVTFIEEISDYVFVYSYSIMFWYLFQCLDEMLLERTPAIAAEFLQSTNFMEKSCNSPNSSPEVRYVWKIHFNDVNSVNIVYAKKNVFIK